MFDFEVSENVDLKKYNTLGLGGITKYFYLPKSADEFIENYEKIKKLGIKYFILGNGSNIILPDNNFDGMIICLKKLKKIKLDKTSVTIDAGIMLSFMNNSLLKKKITMFDWVAGIPGTLGGAIYGNVGAHGHDIFENLISIRVLKSGVEKTILKEDITHSYRHTSLTDEIILSANFSAFKGNTLDALENIKTYSENRFLTQPLEYKNAGSTFKNPEGMSAGKLIDDAGLKGYAINGAQISEKHANFIVNKNGASSKDIISLIKLMQKEVKTKFNVDLELENKIIIWENL